jgi:Fe-S cluster assembly protein SufD
MNPFELQTASDGVSVEESGGAWNLTIPEGASVPAVIAVKTCAGGTLVVRFGARSRASVSLEITGEGRLALEIRVEAGDEANAEFLCLQAADASAQVSITQQSVLGAGASLRSRHASLGASSSDHEVRSWLDGRNARSDIEWICYAKGSEKHQLCAFNVFDAQEGAGEIVMKGVAEQQAHLSQKGTIVIGLSGNGTNTYLTQEVLMLDRTAKVDAVPGLEIKTNDVKASHSATVARVTAEDLFYFASRGIAEHEARRMFVIGFLASLVGRIADDASRERIAALIEAKYDRL